MAHTSEARCLVHISDLILSLSILILVGYFYYLTTTFEEISELFSDAIPPATFPRMMLWVIGFLTLLLPFEHAFKAARGGSDLNADREKKVEPIAYITFSVILVLVASAEWLGTFLTLVAACFVLPALWGERSWLALGLFGLIFPVAVTVLFSQVFKIYFQPGVFGLEFH